MKTSDYFVLGTSHLFHVPDELDWRAAFSAVVERRDIKVDGDAVELLSEAAILRMNYPVPEEGVISFDLFLSRIPSTPGPHGETPKGTVFSNRTTSGVPEKGWPTLRVGVQRKDASSGTLILDVAQSDQRVWRSVTLSSPLESGKWHSLLASWGNRMSLALVQDGPQDARNLIVSSRQVSARPFSTPKVHFFGLGRVDNPYDHGLPYWTPPSLLGAKIRIPGVSLSEMLERTRLDDQTCRTRRRTVRRVPRRP
jgi:hypothetical protein